MALKTSAKRVLSASAPVACQFNSSQILQGMSKISFLWLSHPNMSRGWTTVNMKLCATSKTWDPPSKALSHCPVSTDPLIKQSPTKVTFANKGLLWACEKAANGTTSLQPGVSLHLPHLQHLRSASLNRIAPICAPASSI